MIGSEETIIKASKPFGTVDIFGTSEGVFGHLETTDTQNLQKAEDAFAQSRLDFFEMEKPSIVSLRNMVDSGSKLFNTAAGISKLSYVAIKDRENSDQIVTWWQAKYSEAARAVGDREKGDKPTNSDLRSLSAVLSQVREQITVDAAVKQGKIKQEEVSGLPFQILGAVMESFEKTEPGKRRAMPFMGRETNLPLPGWAKRMYENVTGVINRRSFAIGRAEAVYRKTMENARNLPRIVSDFGLAAEVMV